MGKPRMLGVKDVRGGDLRLRDLSAPETDSETEFLDGDPADQTDQLTDLLADERVVDA